MHDGKSHGKRPWQKAPFWRENLKTVRCGGKTRTSEMAGKRASLPAHTERERRRERRRELKKREKERGRSVLSKTISASSSA